MITFDDIKKDEYPSYYTPYLNLVDSKIDLMTVLEQSLDSSLHFIDSIEKPMDYSYAINKWTIGEVIQHNIDTERVFAYRALRFMRGDSTALSGFDQDVFVDSMKGYAFAKADLLKSLKTIRLATIGLFRNVNDASLIFKGNASNKTMTARVIPFIIAGHNMHHENVIMQRYLS
ncbi:MAG: DinB family protein [Nonlabens sp.]|uniref:DinB family protein n=1 Tax=Nonlabens sp. TaxID=1888209 RepID=UPI00321905AD